LIWASFRGYCKAISPLLVKVSPLLEYPNHIGGGICSWWRFANGIEEYLYQFYGNFDHKIASGGDLFLVFFYKCKQFSLILHLINQSSTLVYQVVGKHV
jgi:hypothetical protein